MGVIDIFYWGKSKTNAGNGLKLLSPWLCRTWK